MKGEYSFIELDLGHWSIQEDYDTISSLILNFINKNSKKYSYLRMIAYTPTFVGFFVCGMMGRFGNL